MSNCGSYGWVTDRTAIATIPTIPKPERRGRDAAGIRALAGQAAAETGFDGFAPEVCLINRYAPGARMSLHQTGMNSIWAHDRFGIAGLPAIFLFGGLKRSDKTRRFRLEHGDVAVWAAPRGWRFMASHRSPMASIH